MRADGWHQDDDVDAFLGRAGGFLRARPVWHIVQLTALARLRSPMAAMYGEGPHVFGRLEHAGEVRATFHRLSRGGLVLTPLGTKQADDLAAHLVAQGHAPPYVSAAQETALAFADAWRRHTGATATLRVRLRLHRLGALTPPEPFPAGRARPAGDGDEEQVMRWCREFAADVGESVSLTAASWARTRFADKRYTFWETPDGTPVSMAGVNPTIAGQAQVDPVYTPAGLRGRGYAAAVTVEVSRAALASGAEGAVLFTNAANPTSNALYRRIGYRPVTDWAVYDFT
ncbi:GNAT family N-acetyltransferase [Streptomyces tagetis]|uniref:GNAT family N-acetyltransferase n=1 Tax=Streptomyces tagetis TaxID=2820809 RepID=A0A941B1T4_9ACTN|nr:GNAT family N-acetyltransferase [Streptomyces sp. RG38]MBQ0826482.1 GNAT family N-acetyltransferase [Streptomyces sp. RG38]